MSIFSKLMSAMRGGGEPNTAISPARGVEPAYAIPTLRFNPERVTEGVKDDLKNNIRKLKEFDESHFDQIYDAALRSISRGRDLATLFNALMEMNINGLRKRRAADIALLLNNKATAIMEKERQESLGVKYAFWLYSGAPCKISAKGTTIQDSRQDAAHKAANGKRYDVSKGMFVDGKWTRPGQEEGCRCVSKPVIKGFS